MKKLLMLVLSFALLLSLGAPTAAAAGPTGDWENVVQVLALTDYDDEGAPVTIGLRADGGVYYAGPADGAYAAVSAWTGVARLEAQEYGLVGYRTDGTVNCVGNYDLSAWTEIRQVRLYYDFALGLRHDGTVLMAENPDARFPAEEEWNFERWTDVVSLSDCWEPIALRADGTLLMSVEEKEFLTEMGWGSAKNWTDIVAVGPWNYGSPAALKADGTVLGMSGEAWHDVVGIRGLSDSVFGLRADGTVAVAPSSEYGADARLDQVRAWTDIASLSCDGGFRFLPVGLRADGTVVSVTVDYEGAPAGTDLSGWTKVRALYTNSVLTLGLRSDGTVLLARDHTDSGDELLADFAPVTKWTGIRALSVSELHAAGLRADGTVVTTA